MRWLSCSACNFSSIASWRLPGSFTLRSGVSSTACGEGVDGCGGLCVLALGVRGPEHGESLCVGGALRDLDDVDAGVGVRDGRGRGDLVGVEGAAEELRTRGE